MTINGGFSISIYSRGPGESLLRRTRLFHQPPSVLFDTPSGVIGPTCKYQTFRAGGKPVERVARAALGSGASWRGVLHLAALGGAGGGGGVGKSATSAGLRAAGGSFGATEGGSMAASRGGCLRELPRSQCSAETLRRQGQMPRRKGVVQSPSQGTERQWAPSLGRHAAHGVVGAGLICLA